MPVPSYEKLFNPLLQVIRELGGSASIAEQEEKVADILHISDEEIDEIHAGNRTKLNYRLAWSRHYLKKFGLLENSTRGVWSLTQAASTVKKVDPASVSKLVHAQAKGQNEAIPAADDKRPPAELAWEDEALELLKSITPKSFEHLCQRLLRESGFIQVEVLGKSGDGGIDGRGVVKLGGILSFHVRFQCKRYRDTVSASVVRDFRGAMVRRADKGLLLTTGTFSRDARAEAQRDGAPRLDLVDGDDLVQMLKALRLGIQVQQKIVEEAVVDRAWFETL